MTLPDCCSVEAEMACGCLIAYHSHAQNFFVEWCPLHRTAEKMLAACKDALGEIRAELASHPRDHGWNKVAKHLTAVIAEAERKDAEPCPNPEA